MNGHEQHPIVCLPVLVSKMHMSNISSYVSFMPYMETISSVLCVLRKIGTAWACLSDVTWNYAERQIHVLMPGMCPHHIFVEYIDVQRVQIKDKCSANSSLFPDAVGRVFSKRSEVKRYGAGVRCCTKDPAGGKLCGGHWSRCQGLNVGHTVG